MLRSWRDELGCPGRDPAPTTASSARMCRVRAWAAGPQQLRMEFFYREMRKRTGLLMDGDGSPMGGQWNFDADNRKPLPDGPDAAASRCASRPMRSRARCIALVGERFADHFGALDAFGWPVTRARGAGRRSTLSSPQALPRFGDYQDAMLHGRAVRSITRSCRPTSTSACSTRSSSAAAPRRAIARAMRRSTRSKASSARSSAGANMCAASTGSKMPDYARDATPRRTRAAAGLLLDRRDRHALPARRRSARRARTPTRTISSG